MRRDRATNEDQFKGRVAWLEVVGVSKYYGALAAIRDVSFTARPGEVLGYLGPNGSGRATTVSMTAGLLQPSDGEIRVDGENMHRDILGHRRRIGTCRRRPTGTRT